MSDSGIVGCWRSYQVFYARGSVQKNMISEYKEIAIDKEGVLVIKPHCDCPEPAIIKTTNWEIQQTYNGQFLFVNGQKTYEIITWEINDLVLLELSSGQKVFYTSLQQWFHRIKTQPEEIIIEEDPIALWSPSLISCVK